LLCGGPVVAVPSTSLLAVLHGQGALRVVVFWVPRDARAPATRASEPLHVGNAVTHVTAGG